MNPILGHLMENILYVQDMNAQVRFYRDTLGLAIKYPAGLEDYANEFWVELDTGPCALVLHGGGQRRLGADSPKFVFHAPDITTARATLVGRGVQLGEIRSPAPRRPRLRRRRPRRQPLFTGKPRPLLDRSTLIA